jgi:hypothetical protein
MAKNTFNPTINEWVPGQHKYYAKLPPTVKSYYENRGLQKQIKDIKIQNSGNRFEVELTTPVGSSVARRGAKHIWELSPTPGYGWGLTQQKGK